MIRPSRVRRFDILRSSAGIAPVLVFMAVAVGHAEPALSATPTFAAHEVHGGLAIDHMDGGMTAVATAPAWIRLPGKPDFVVKDGKGEEAALWITAPSSVVVRKGASTDSPIDGRVEPRWDDEAIRLRIEPAHAAALESDVFEREDLGAGPRELSRTALLSTDVQGSYRAVLRDPAGKPVGWMRVKVTTHGGSPTRFEAALPPEIDEGLAVASAAALGEEVDHIDAESYGAHRGPMRRP
jgi:hypothetical protein